MTVIRIDNGASISDGRKYETDKTNIRDVVAEFGRANDTLELYDDAGNLVARAIWPIGSKCYMYSTGKNLNANPAWSTYTY